MKIILRDCRDGGKPASGPAAEIPSFLLASQTRARRGPFFLSAAIHVVALVLAPAVAGVLPLPARLPKQNFARSITIQMPRPRERDAIRDAEIARQLADRARQLIDAMKATPIDPGVAAASIPDGSGGRSQTEQVLLQPAYPADLVPEQAPTLPTMMIWSPAPVPPRRTAVLPAQKQPELPQPALNVAGTPVQPQAAAPADPAPFLEPARQPAPAPPAGAAQTLTTADNVAVLSLSSVRTSASSLTIPPGNIIPAGGAGSGSGGRTANQAANGTGVAQAAGTAPAGTESGTASGAAAGVAGAPQGPASARPGVASGGSAPVPAAVEVQQVTHPANGRFDVVVVQNSLAESVAEAGVALSGRPVYTVYLDVGDQKQWVMHFCAPEAAVTQRGGIVQLPDARPLKPPFPQVTFRPVQRLLAAGSHLLVHAFIDEAGAFQQVRVVGEKSQSRATLMAALEKWRFQPALRAGLPARVEVLLAIPVADPSDM